MRGVVKGLDNKIDVLARRISNMPKIPEPVTGGGIVDIAKLQTSGVVGLPWLSGESDINFGAVTYGAATSSVDGSAVDWLSVTGSDIYPTEDGFYQAWCKVALVWSSEANAPGASLSI